MRQRAVLSLVLVILLTAGAACVKTGPPDTTSSSTEASPPPTTKKKENTVEDFCAAVEDNKADLISGSSESAADPETFLTGLKKLQKKATKQIKPVLATLVDLYAATEGLSGAELEDKLSELNRDPDFRDNLKELNDYVSDKCDVQLNRVATTRTTRRATTTSAGPNSSGVAKDAIDGLKKHLNDNYLTTVWYDKISGLKVSVDVSANTADFTIIGRAGATLASDEAVAVCEATAEFVDKNFTGGAVTVDDSAGTTLASRASRSTKCAAA